MSWGEIVCAELCDLCEGAGAATLHHCWQFPELICGILRYLQSTEENQRELLFKQNGSLQSSQFYIVQPGQKERDHIKLD